MAPADADKLLDRVRKLLALAGSPNVHEAAAAAARAQSLIQTHRLQALLDAERLADPQIDPDPITDGRDAPLEQGRRLRKWKIYLATRLAQVNGCIAYTAPVGREQQLLLAGRAADRAAVVELWQWLVHRIELCSATEASRLAAEEPEAGTPDRAWHEAFRVGAAEVVARRLEQVGEQVRDQARASLGTAALARVEPALAARQAAVDTFADQNLRLKRGRSLRVDADAYRRGRAAGARLALPDPE